MSVWERKDIMNSINEKGKETRYNNQVLERIMVDKTIRSKINMTEPYGDEWGEK